MTGIDANKINDVVARAKQIYRSKAFGGISEESANNAISNIVDNIKCMAEEAVSTVQRELDGFKGKTAREMADLTSQRDAFIQKAQKEAERANNAEAKIQQGMKSKVGKPKVLENGNIEYKKVNKNGATLTVEKTQDGKLIRVKGEDIDGNLRETTFNTETGKRVKTFTNVNGDKVYDYEHNVVKELNRVKSQTPKMLSEEIVKKDLGHNIMQLKRSYSDGSVEYVSYDMKAQIETSSRKLDKHGNFIETKELDTDVRGRAYLLINKYNQETGRKAEVIKEYPNGVYSKLLLTQDGYPYKIIEKTSQGLRREIVGKVDKYGNVNLDNPELKYIYPKTSKIKSSKVEMDAIYHVNKETLQMRDGTIVTVKVDGNYHPYVVTVQDANGSRQIDRDKIDEFLTSIGKIGHFEDKDYYSNYISRY